MGIINTPANSFYLQIEGMDLAGKSTVSKTFSQISNLSWIIRDKTLMLNNPIYDFAIGLSTKSGYDSFTLGYMYLAALIHDLKHFKLEANIIQDSSLLVRSLNYYKNVNVNIDLANAFSSLIQKHPMPNKSFYLTADINSRLQRLEQRKKESPEKITMMDLLIQNDPKKFIQFDETLKDLSIKIFNSEVIDTSQMSIMEVVKCLVKAFASSYK